MPAAASRTALGAACWTATEKVNAELFALTHGAFVRQILRDHEDDVECANAALERVGRAMGARMVEEFLSRTNASGGACATFEEAMEMTTRVGLKMFLNVDAKTSSFGSLTRVGALHTLHLSIVERILLGHEL